MSFCIVCILIDLRRERRQGTVLALLVGPGHGHQDVDPPQGVVLLVVDQGHLITRDAKGVHHHGTVQDHPQDEDHDHQDAVLHRLAEGGHLQGDAAHLQGDEAHLLGDAVHLQGDGLREGARQGKVHLLAGTLS